MYKRTLRTFLLIFYVLLMIGEINNNEFEEEFNENVSSELYTDFDNDGEFDFDADDEEESSSSLKMSHAQLSSSRTLDIALPVPSSMNTAYRGFYSQEYLDRIFMPPKA